MPVPVAVVLTLCFAGCGGYAASRLRSAGGPCTRRRYAAHLAMAVAMVVMAWATPPTPVAYAAGCAFVTLAAWFVWEGVREDRAVARLASLHHAVMAAVMAVMYAAMVAPAGEAAGGHHQGTGGPALGLAASSLLVGALLLAPAGVVWLESRHRDRWLEGAAGLGMALGAAAMAVAH
ncbi:DUF5134 domain-containing protein [Nocardioides humi]|uniref:DUF5134 domain-containing protein n=1 Tax=Nocardioides humi TaxID=449461 RepID=A0ABN2AKH6_9ACTN|nr:DUF5134 domain-containing protein [Nocardioides humi]